ncbi:hypothetical protein FACS1894211_02980 [Clostridia bacterium]|nr:hypothetical protein FACS1894211_02980 [Clostridia bacterium]
MPETVQNIRYINREYGFTFRPPFFDKFHEESRSGPQVGPDNFPGKFIIGAGYDYSAINGALFAGENGSLWGIKVSYYDGKKWLDNEDFIRNMGIGCANTADGSFAHFSSGPLSVKWARYNDRALALEISARKRLRVRVIFYPAYKWFGELSIEGAYVKGRSPYVAVVPGEIELTDAYAVYKGRYQAVLGDDEGREYFMAQSYNKPNDSANGAFNEAIMEFTINENQPRVYLYAAIGGEEVLTDDVPRLDRVVRLIETAELRYGVNKTTGTGTLGQATESMLNSIMWSRIYYPYLIDTLYSPARSALDDHFNITGFEENCAALLGCFAGKGTESAMQLRYTVEDKLIAMLAALHIFLHTPGKAMFIRLLPRMKKLYPVGDAELVVAKDHTQNEVAYKWTDSPLKESGNGQPMFSLDLSCLKLLAFDILERFLHFFEKEDEAKEYARAKEELRGKINETFWNDDKGMYKNRDVTGSWGRSYGATSFYPLVAGAVDTPAKLSKMMNMLTDPKIFWGENIIPTLSKDDRRYGKKGPPAPSGEREPKFLQYRGSIVPYVNYIVYHGLVRYGLDQLAGELAHSGARLWQARGNSPNVENYSLYLPNGRRVRKKRYLSNTGNMLALVGIQELLDVEYFREDLNLALRFGTFCKGNHSVTNLRILDKYYGIEVNEGTTTLLVNNQTLFEAAGGRCVVRQFVENDRGCEFLIDAQYPLKVNLFLYKADRNRATGDYAVHFSVPQGKCRVSVRGKDVSVLRIF